MPCPLLFLGEAWGEPEARWESPFVGAAGQELSRMLSQAGFPCKFLPYNFTSSVRMISYWKDFPFPLLNVFNERPPENDVSFFYSKADRKSLYPLQAKYPRRIDNSIVYLKPEYEHHLTTLHAELLALKPNVIVALGNTALWSLGLPQTISSLRGNILSSPFGKVISTYHPASVLRKWDQRIIALLDFRKALRESKSPDINTISREIWTEPSIEDLYTWWDKYGYHASLLSFDIETLLNQQISEISFASDSTHALHIPFVWREGSTYHNWWPDVKTELAAWQFVKMVCESSIPKIGQNCVQYDTYWLLKVMNIQVRNIIHDTMVMSHAWQPELEKSLQFLGSIFLDERSWKGIRKEVNKLND